MKSVNTLITKGYQVYTNEKDLVETIKNLISKKHKIIRDVSISNIQGKAQMLATKDDFWFHTDGVYMPIPPHWIIIKIIKAEHGGAIELLDSNLFLSSIENKAYKFGKANQFIKACLLENYNNSTIFRYRKDYMSKTNISNQSQSNIDTLIHQHLSNSIHLGKLRAETSIIINNWRFLHRRKPFTGERTIRRIWIS